mmetsp:Transcript_48705/g.55213  ORF Transcript_48705/g.55213 Transcript_48705/m.55213 type:complete len:88 (+) Transcript_48705:293-556(+)
MNKHNNSMLHASVGGCETSYNEEGYWRAILRTNYLCLFDLSVRSVHFLRFDSFYVCPPSTISSTLLSMGRCYWNTTRYNTQAKNNTL